MSKVVKCTESPRRRTAKVVTQSNHDGGLIPSELSEYADKPLYILIALWALQQKSWIGHRQISAAFSITERRASFQLSYILRKKEIIQCQTRKIKVSGTRRLSHQIFIEQVSFSGMAANTTGTEKLSCPYRKQLGDEPGLSITQAIV